MIILTSISLLSMSRTGLISKIIPMILDAFMKNGYFCILRI